MASTIPTHATGDYLSSSDWNTLVPLNKGVALNAAGSAFLGTPPLTTAPNFLLAAGYGSTVSFTAGNGSILWTAFPAGVLAVTITANAAADVTVCTVGTPSLAGVGLYATSAGAAFTGTLGIHYIVVGF